MKRTKDCEVQGGYIDYIRLPYCQLNGSIGGAVVIYLLWLTFLFINIALTVKYFLYPSLDAISKILRLSESVAGVTFLALGNGAADIFSLIVLMTKEDNDGSFAETAMGGILGGGLFVTSVVVGLICFNYQLKVRPVSFLRDVLFYLAAVTWLLIMIIDGRIIVGEAIGFICLYVFYVVVVLLGLRWEKKVNENDETEALTNAEESTSPQEPDANNAHISKAESSSSSHDNKGEYSNLIETDDSEESISTKRPTTLSPTRYQCWQLLQALCPYTLDDFLKSR